MNYNGTEYDLTTGLKYNITFAQTFDYCFKITFENVECLNKVYVKSTRNNVSYYLEANWNDELKCYMTEGHFIEDDPSYVPGSLSVEYSKIKQEPYSIIEMESYYQEILHENQNKFSKMEHETKEQDDGSIQYMVKVGDIPELMDLGVDLYNMTVKEISKDNNIDWYGYYSGMADCYTYFFDEGNEKYYLNLDYSDDKTYVMIIDDISSNKLYKVAINAISEGIKNPIASCDFDSLTGFLSCFDSIKKVMDINDDYDTLLNNIYSAGLSREEIDSAVKAAKELKRDREMYLITTLLISVITIESGGLPFALLMGAINKIAEKMFEMRASGIIEGKHVAKVNWCIDPSGYVFDFETNERISGAKMTVYWIPYDEDDENFWDKHPSDEQYGMAWVAEDYSQINPLMTDANGCYAWDVPEGWWRVKAEKAQYETAWSEWVPVPPIQTEVNIAMKFIGTVVIKGDVNGDGEVNRADRIYLARAIAGWDGYELPDVRVADFNGDGEVNRADRIYLARAIAGWDGYVV